MPLELRLTDLPMPRLDGIRLKGVTQTVQQITSRNLAKATHGVESKPFKNCKEQMKRRLIERFERGKSVTFEQATDVEGRERLLLSLYLEYSARNDSPWLPPFDQSVAKSVLGAGGNNWHGGHRRLATQLFFTHYDRLPADGLSQLSAKLVEAYAGLEVNRKNPADPWRQNRLLLFNAGGHHQILGAAMPFESLPEITVRFAIPKEGRFVECLRQVFLLNALRVCTVGQEISELREIESLKNERASAAQLIGAAALQIMVQRVAKEGRSKWSGDWPHWITRLGCDPRHGRATGEGAKWWGWATDDELRLAQQGITGLTLRFFIDFLRRSLQGTDKEPQFALRSRFLIGLFEAGKIESARLALNFATYERLDQRYRDTWSVAHLSQTSDDTSMICLKCVQDVFVIEGTHSFGLRMFHRSFPIRGFWERPKRTYQDSELRITPSECPVFLRHDRGGNWVNNFFLQLRSRFHVEWGDVRI